MRVARPLFAAAFALAAISAALAPSALANGKAPSGAEGAMCGTIVGLVCNEGLWCETRVGLCNAPDADGTCVKVSPMCTREYRPVCGCDNHTYGNDCDRRAAKVAKLHDGVCNPP